MNTIGSRIKEIRTSQSINLTQSEFGKKIGVSYSAIGLYENDKRTVPETVKKAICREFNVNYFYLTEGQGDMFVGLPETLIDEIVIEYGLDEEDKNIIIEYTKLNKENRRIIKSYMEFLLTKKDLD